MNDTQIPAAGLAGKVARAPMLFKVSILKVANGYIVSKDFDYPSHRSSDDTFIFPDVHGVLAQIKGMIQVEEVRLSEQSKPKGN